MLDISKILIDGGILSALFVVLVLAIAAYNPRLFLNKGDVPPDILAAVPPKTGPEKRLANWLGIPLFMILILGPIYSTYTRALAAPNAGFVSLYLHALLVLLLPTLADLILVDWLILNTFTPKMFVYPGTEGFTGYKDYGFHLRGHLKVFPMMLLGSVITAELALLGSRLL